MHKKISYLALCLSVTGSVVQADVLELFSTWTKFNTERRKEIRDAFTPPTPPAVKKETEPGLDGIVGNRPAAVEDIIDFFQNRAEREAQGLEMPRGLLLCGPAGTGKTSLAKAIARDLGMSYIELSASDLEEVFVGLGASRIRTLFNDARKLAAKTGKPCIVIIDEVDALGNRDSVFGTMNRQLIDALLAEMDGIHSSSNVFVIGTTNDTNHVDSALRRPGRFDYVVEIPLPDKESRKAIIEYYLHKRKYAHDIDLDVVAHDSKGFSGAELKEIIKRAAMTCVRNKRSVITQDDLDAGFKQLVKEKSNRR